MLRLAVGAIVALFSGAPAALAQTTQPTPPAAPVPSITISAPSGGASYERSSNVRAHFRCSEAGAPGRIVSCTGTVANGHRIDTRRVGRKTFTVTAVDASGQRVVKTVRYKVWAYVNPVRSVSGLRRGRVDMGVDYAGSGPVLAIGAGKVTKASNNDGGPPSCWGRSCWPGGGIVVYRLLEGPFAGKYIYVAENITVTVKTGQIVKAGEQIAILHPAYPHMEIGWASGHGAETLAISRNHQCSCGDPGGWSSIEGRDFNDLLRVLGAPAGYLQSSPGQSMPRGWPRRCTKASPGLC